MKNPKEELPILVKKTPSGWMIENTPSNKIPLSSEFNCSDSWQVRIPMPIQQTPEEKQRDDVYLILCDLEQVAEYFQSINLEISHETIKLYDKIKTEFFSE